MKWLIFVTLTLWIYLILLWLTSRRRRMDVRVGTAIATHEQPARTDTKKKKAPNIRNIARKLASNSLKNFSQTRLEKVQYRLTQAGSPGNYNVAEWVGLRFVLAGVGALLGLCLLWFSQGQMIGLLMLLTLLLLGWIGPDFWLSRRIKLRQGTLLRELPNVLDLLTVSVEAGLGFDQAMARVSEKLKGSLGEEFERALREMRLGSQRIPALQRLAARTGVDAVRSFVSAVVQADRLGVGMVQVLRIQAAEVRRKRRMDAQERAMKAPVKMLFPLVVFVFPAMFVIILGPAVIHMLSVFSGGL